MGNVVKWNSREERAVAKILLGKLSAKKQRHFLHEKEQELHQSTLVNSSCNLGQTAVARPFV